MSTIRQQREEIKQLKATQGNLRSIIKSAMGNGGVIPANFDGPADPESVAGVSVEDQVKIRVALIDAIADAGVDRKLTMAALQADKALDAIDPASESLEDDLADLMDVTVAKYPNLKLRGSDVPSASGGSFPPGSGGVPAVITQEQLALMTPEQRVNARKAGLLGHLNIGSG